MMLLKLIIISIISVVCDRSLPLSMRMYGSAIMPWVDEVAVKKFNHSYGFVSFPRTAFLILTCLAFSFGEMVVSDQEVVLWVMLALVLFWFLAALVDVWKALKYARQ